MLVAAFIKPSVSILHRKHFSTNEKVLQANLHPLIQKPLERHGHLHHVPRAIETTSGHVRTTRDRNNPVDLEKGILNVFSTAFNNAALRNFFPVNTIGTILGSVVENVFLSYFTGNKPGSSVLGTKRILKNFESNLVGVMERPSLYVAPLLVRDPVSSLLNSPKAIDPTIALNPLSLKDDVLSESTNSNIIPLDEIQDLSHESHINEEKQQQVTASSVSIKRKVPLPFMNLATIGITGDWKKIGENFVLYPPLVENDGAIKRPRAIIHFLGAAFVGAAPHLSYRYLLESLGNLGYVVVATPYKLDFDYLSTCDSILQQLDIAKNDIVNHYGEAPPIIGMGHSGGALLHMFLSSFFQEDANKHSNIFLGINDRPIVDAVSAFQDLIVPLARRVIGNPGSSPSQTSKSFTFMRKYLETAVGLYSNSSWSPSFFNKDIVPLFQEGLAMVDQVPPLLKSIANGTVSFHPPSQQARDSFRLMYRAKHTLLVKMANDTHDESIEFERILNEANTIMKMKQNRNLDHMMVDVLQLEGNGYVPFTQSIMANISDISSFFKVSGDPLKFCSKTHQASFISLKEIIKRVDNYIQEITVVAATKSDDVSAPEIESDTTVKEVVVATPTDISQSTVASFNPSVSVNSFNAYLNNPSEVNVKVTEFATQCHDAVHNVTIVTTAISKTAKSLELKKLFDLSGLKTSQYVERFVGPHSLVSTVSRPSGNLLTKMLSTVRTPLQLLEFGLKRSVQQLLLSLIDQMPTLLQQMVVVAFWSNFPFK